MSKFPISSMSFTAALGIQVDALIDWHGNLLQIIFVQLQSILNLQPGMYSKVLGIKMIKMKDDVEK